jgi:hypothetical protein
MNDAEGFVTDLEVFEGVERRDAVRKRCSVRELK